MTTMVVALDRNLFWHITAFLFMPNLDFIATEIYVLKVSTTNTVLVIITLRHLVAAKADFSYFVI